MQVNGIAQNYSTQNAQNNYDKNMDDSSVDMQDFLNLLVAQMTNQDVMNPMDNTEFVSQLAQFSSLKALTTLSEIKQQEQATSLIGKDVIMASYNEEGELEKVEGKVEKVTLFSGEVNLYVKGKEYTMSNLMEIKEEGSDQ